MFFSSIYMEKISIYGLGEGRPVGAGLGRWAVGRAGTGGGLGVGVKEGEKRRKNGREREGR